MQIREPNFLDIEALVSLMLQLGYPITNEKMKENILFFSSQPLYKAWVAELDKKVIGSIALVVTHYFHRKGSFLKVITMVVDQNHRREGVGKKLMEEAEKYARRMHCSHIELTSGVHRKSAHDFYKSLGFEELNDQKKYFGKKLIKMAKF